MKRGRDDEKTMGFMFPRLHVNDTERGGPRAPPRNKMALYEQFSVPSQRFNKSNNNSSLIPTASGTQGTGHEKNLLFPPQRSLAAPIRQTERFQTSTSGGASLNSASLLKKVGHEDDFTVPVFDEVRIGQSKPLNVTDRQNLASPNQEFQDLPTARLCVSRDNKVCIEEKLQKSRASSQSEKNGRGDSVVECSLDRDGVPQARSRSPSGDNHSNSNEPDDGNEYCADRTCSPQQIGNEDKSDAVSETSMVDSISGTDMSPDDVVGIIGQKHFWKARRAIVNQQRVFAVQVFELHRLIKVQRLIAESPQLLVEDAATFLSNFPLKAASPAKKLPSEYVLKPQTQFKHKEDSPKASDKVEFSAENAVGRTSLPSARRNGTQPSTLMPQQSEDPPLQAYPTTDNYNQTNNWYFHQSPPGHQWLVPVMSPSEGLVYKPYPGPGFMGTPCGGYGPYGSMMTPPYGVPPQNPPVGNSYLPSPYGMSVMHQAMSGSVEQMSWYPMPYPNSQSGHLSGGIPTFNMQQQSSCNVRNPQINEVVSQAVKFQAPKESRVQQASTASSPSDRIEGHTTGQVADRRDVLPLIPIGPIVPEGGPQPLRRVIRVVPHNPRIATESAARIFQSIQEERNQQDSN